MDDAPPATVASCCDGELACVFSKALLAHSAVCELSARRALAERETIECSSPVARINCSTFAALLHERARFPMRLPAAHKPLMHMQALRLQCGGLLALQKTLSLDKPDVHQMIGATHERYGSLTELPWEALVSELVAWQPPRRGRARQ